MIALLVIHVCFLLQVVVVLFCFGIVCVRWCVSIFVHLHD